MILLTPSQSPDARGCQAAIAIFGVGTIGSAIAASLQEMADLDIRIMPLDWRIPDVFAMNLDSIERLLMDLLAGAMTSIPPEAFHVIWSAGRAGFYSTDEEVARELAMYEEVLRCVERLSARFPEVPCHMVLTSSAGGLFEGQQGVRRETLPVPTRPYGRLKLMQEQLLLNSQACLARKIYRLSSVYGYIRADQRRGLIPTLIANGLRQRSSQITGHSSTIRDYVWIEDVAEYISRQVLAGSQDDCVMVLASMKPSSIFEIQRIVEILIGRPLYLCFLPQATNVMPITFDTSAVPSDWRPSELPTNVRKIAVDALARQTAFLEA